jgi:hypothetical protein
MRDPCLFFYKSASKACFFLASLLFFKTMTPGFWIYLTFFCFCLSKFVVHMHTRPMGSWGRFYPAMCTKEVFKGGIFVVIHIERHGLSGAIHLQENK